MGHIDTRFTVWPATRYGLPPHDWLSRLGSNQRQSACKTGALPTELIAYIHLVGRGGVEPPQSQTADLQSVGLATCSASPLSFLILYIYYIIIEQEVKSLFN